MPRNNRGGRNNNPTGRNQFSSDWGVMEMARERPMTAAAVAAGTAAAGLFLWSKRAQISDQLTHLSDQISERFGGSEFGQFDEFDDTGGLTTSASTGSRPTGTRGRSSQRGMSETGGGNASFGKVSGGSGITGSASGRGRARKAPTG
jgi:hypothetical protein